MAASYSACIAAYRSATPRRRAEALA
jgi:hypothetical protein